MVDPRDEILELYRQSQAKYSGVSARRELRQKLKQEGYRESLTEAEYRALKSELRPVTQKRSFAEQGGSAPIASSLKTAKENYQAQQQQQTSSNFQLTPEERQRVASVYTGDDKITPRQGETVQEAVLRSRAENITEQYQLRQAYPGTSAQATALSNRFGTQSRVDIQKPQTVTRTEVQQERAEGYEQRTESLLQREERLKEFTTLGGRLSPNYTQKPYSLGNIGKAVARKPLEIGSAPVFLGGRVAFAAESLFYNKGRQELVRAAKATPKAVLESYNPKRPEGLINIGLTALAVKSVAGKIKAVRQQQTVSAQGYSTKRIITKDKIIDSSKGRVEVLVGKKKVIGQFTGKETLNKINSKQYLGKGTGQIKITSPKGTKTVKLDTRSISTVKGKEINTATIAKTSGKYYITATKTQQQVPTSFKSFSITKTLGKKTPITSAKPESVSAAITAESFRKPVLSESGKLIATEQLLRTGRVSMGATTFNKFYTNAPITPGITGRINAPAGTTVLKSGKIGTTQGQALLDATIKTSQTTAQQVFIKQPSLNLQTSGVLSTVKTSQKTKNSPTVKVTQERATKPTPIISLQAKTSQTNKLRPYTTETISIIPSESIRTSPAITPGTSEGTSQETPQIIQPVQSQVIKPVTPSTPGTPIAPVVTSPNTPLIPPVPFPGADFAKFPSPKRKIKKPKQGRKYRPSLIGIEKKLKRRRTTKLTGFEARGL